MYILHVFKFIMMRRHKSFERMTNEHELEVFVKNSLLGNKRQCTEQIHVTFDSLGMNVETGWSAVGS